MIERLENQTELLERHVEVLELVVKEGPIGIEALAEKTDYESHVVRYSLRRLEEESIIEPTSTGAVPMDGAKKPLMDHDSRLDTIVNQLAELRTDFSVESG